MRLHCQHLKTSVDKDDFGQHYVKFSVNQIQRRHPGFGDDGKEFSMTNNFLSKLYKLYEESKLKVYLFIIVIVNV